MSSRALASPAHRRGTWIAGASAILVVWSWYGTGIDPGAALGRDGLGQIAAYVLRLFPPDVSPATLRDAAAGAAETFAISLVGSVLAVLIALPMSLATARTLLLRGVLFEAHRPTGVRRLVRVSVLLAGKSVLNVLRTVPEIVWALIFVFMVGLGPFPGVLALALQTGGVLGKLFSEALDDVDPTPLEALQATGASRMRIVLYGVLPQALPQFLSYALYRWEVNIRAAAMMGFVGAGGLGQRIYIAISLFHEHQLLTLILAMYVIVTLVDALSAYPRSRVV